ncbi:MAG: cyclodeaminase/cyclohydrolase family protein [Acidimicrobiales bacterium]
MDSVSPGDFLSLSLDEFLSRVSMPEPAPAAGSVAALAVALAASLCVKAARLSAAQMTHVTDLVTRAGGLRDRASLLCDADALVYGDVVAARRDGAELASALSVAADVPLAIAALGAEVAEVAAQLAERGNASLLGDAVTAALVAAAAARSVAGLVAINLADRPDDDRHARARDLVDVAAACAARATRQLAG